MAFVRSKTVGGHTYYALVENRRVRGKVVQDVIANMYTCPTVEEAYQHWKKLLNWRGPLGIRTLSEVDAIRAKNNMNALSEHRDSAVVKAEDVQREERSKQRAASPSGKRRAEEQRQKHREWDKMFGTHIAEAIRRRNLSKHVETLGLRPEQATDSVAVKTAYRALAKLHHPDAGGDPVKFMEINEAYKTLMQQGT